MQVLSIYPRKNNMHTIEILPSPEYLGRQNDQYAFAYQITITNRSEFAVKLLNRHWIITHGNGYIEEVPPRCPRRFSTARDPAA